ncbi:MAG: M23 family metallopeptidase [Chloroflexi bacterium]|nr:M23 family metallopeptidase [Chloroflexota bacterium]
MRITLGIVILAVVIAACVFLCVIALYAAGALAAAEAVRPVPFVGPIASERIVAWVMGSTEPDTIEDVPPLGADTSLTDTRYYTGTIGDWGPADCGVPRSLPVNGRITSGFRPPDRPNHTGIDISVVSSTPVQATQCGIVSFAGWTNVGYGYLVVVQHDRYATYYAHNSSLIVQPGDKVGLGQVISLSGNTGESTGPHVHYETRVDGVAVNPLTSFP